MNVRIANLIVAATFLFASTTLAKAPTKTDFGKSFLAISADNNIARRWRRNVAQACRQSASDLLHERNRTVRLHQAEDEAFFFLRTNRSTTLGLVTVNDKLWLAPADHLVMGAGLQELFAHECKRHLLRAYEIPTLPLLLEEGVAAWLAGAPGGRCKQPQSVLRGLSNAKARANIIDARRNAGTCIANALEGLRHDDLRRFLFDAATNPKWWETKTAKGTQPLLSLAPDE